MAQQLTLGLHQPGMSFLHRIGLAGLHMTLRSMGQHPGIAWETSPTEVRMELPDDATQAVDSLLRQAFGVQDGMLDFAAHRGIGMPAHARIHLSECLRMTFLQHNQQNKIPKGTQDRSVSLDFGEKQVIVTYKPFGEIYAHTEAVNLLLEKKGRLSGSAAIKGWLFPGAAERHSGLTKTEVEEPAGRLLCLLFAPVACLYYRLYHRALDGKSDKRRGFAIVAPHVTDLDHYADAYAHFLTCPVERLWADGLGDAGLSALITLKAGMALDQIGVRGCTVITMGSVTWSSQQKTRTGVLRIEEIDASSLDTFDHALRAVPNRVVFKEEDRKSRGQKAKKASDAGTRYFVAASLCRGLIAENIANGRDWFLGFAQLMISQKQAKIVSYEKGGLAQMVEETNWSIEAERRFVRALHTAIRSRYGALAAQAKQRGENIRFDREFERMRTGLGRAKNAQTLRSEIADLFARGGLNKELQQHWQDILPLFSGNDWQRARDLAFLALASYSGKGADEIAEPQQIEEEDA